MHVGSEEDAKDILQETMLGIWRGISGFDRKSSFRTWALGITRRKIADHYRRSYRQMENRREDISECSNELYAEGSMEQQLTDAITVQNVVNALDAEDKELVYLVFNAQLSYKEVSALTGLPEGTIKSRMFMLRKKLKNMPKEGGIDG